MFNLSSLMFLDPAQITLIVVVAALLIFYPIFMYIRNKKDREKRTELYETIRKGDYVITYYGIMGKVVEILEKQNGKFLTLQTGEGKNSGYVCVTIDAVYSFADNKDKIFGTDGEPITENVKEDKKNKEQKSDEKAEVVEVKPEETNVEEVSNEIKVEEKVDEKPVKKSSKSKNSNKKA